MPGLVRSVALYFAMQAVAVAAWWLLLVLRPASRIHFQFGASDASLIAFWLPDLLLVAGGSAAASALSFRRSEYVWCCALLGAAPAGLVAATSPGGAAAALLKWRAPGRDSHAD